MQAKEEDRNMEKLMNGYFGLRKKSQISNVLCSKENMNYGQV